MPIGKMNLLDAELPTAPFRFLECQRRGLSETQQTGMNSNYLRCGEKVRRDGSLRYEGQFACAGYRTVHAPDRKGKIRNAIVFNLVSIDEITEPEQVSLDGAELSLAELRQQAIDAASTPKELPRDASRTVHGRSALVRAYVLKRANGQCELCGGDAPFSTRDGEPYLEPHHIRRLSDGGPDDPRFMGRYVPTVTVKSLTEHKVMH